MNNSEFSPESTITIDVFTSIHIFLVYSNNITNNISNNISSDALSLHLDRLIGFCESLNIDIFDKNQYYLYINPIKSIQGTSRLVIKLIKNNFPVLNSFLTNGNSIADYLSLLNLHNPDYHCSDPINIYTITGKLVSNDKLINITELSYSNNKWYKFTKKLDLSRLPNLKTLSLYNNNIYSIDLSKNILLTELNISANNLTRIDLSNNKELVKLFVSSNNLNYLDVSRNTMLTVLDASYNINLNEVTLCKSLQKLRIKNCSIENINVRGCKDLILMDLRHNSLDNIDISSCEQLTKLYLTDNGLTSLDVSRCKKLLELEIDINWISTIDLSELEYYNDGLKLRKDSKCKVI